MPVRNRVEGSNRSAPPRATPRAQERRVPYQGIFVGVCWLGFAIVCIVMLSTRVGPEAKTAVGICFALATVGSCAYAVCFCAPMQFLTGNSKADFASSVSRLCVDAVLVASSTCSTALHCWRLTLPICLHSCFAAIHQAENPGGPPRQVCPVQPVLWRAVPHSSTYVSSACTRLVVCVLRAALSSNLGLLRFAGGSSPQEAVRQTSPALFHVESVVRASSCHTPPRRLHAVVLLCSVQ